MVYMHIAVPLLMLLFMWVHIQRHAHARVNPPRALARRGARGARRTLAGRAGHEPGAGGPGSRAVRRRPRLVLSHGVPAARHRGAAARSGQRWSAAACSSRLLPWLPPLRKAPPAVVNLENCNGCGRCFADCPFGAITMVGRTDGAEFDQEARVDADMCMSCGICVGACPTATPFRRASALVPGIELPADPIAGLRDQVRRRDGEAAG